MAKAKASIREMVELAKGNGIIPVLATEVTIRGKDSWSETVAGWVGWILGKKSYQDYVNKHVIATNKWIKEFAKKNNIIVLDFQTLLSAKDGYRKKEYAQPDGSHISQKGYEKISKYTDEVLSNYYKNR
ncbi:MAG: SGNH/GDSL hydrolase family protein [Candidatus Mariimomonas ferrooxydans]